jgi:hypothetical protein
MMKYQFEEAVCKTSNSSIISIVWGISFRPLYTTSVNIQIKQTNDAMSKPMEKPQIKKIYR